MKIALAQLNPIIGDLEGNLKLVKEAAKEASRLGADLLVTPEMIVCGYPPKDLLLREGFIDRCDQSVEELAKEIPYNLGVLIGHPTFINQESGRPGNGASLIYQGQIQKTITKALLPNYDVFDERRYFQASTNIEVIEFQGKKLGVHICEDAWWGDESTHYHNNPTRFPNPVEELAKQEAEILINLSASPFEIAKRDRRTEIASRHAKEFGLPFLFVNQVGGNDDLVFDGHSLIVNSEGELAHLLDGFKSEIKIVDFNEPLVKVVPEKSVHEGMLLDALVLGLKDYMQKCGFTDCVLGLSGGIDSALACYIAAKAIGPKHVHALLMPSRYSSDHSVDDSVKLAKNMGLDYEIISIDQVHKAYELTEVIQDDLKKYPSGLGDQNLQARIRGAMVMVRSNTHGWIALATGNKSELAVGYCTLYGDMAGGFAVLCDVYKRDVYAVSRYINQVIEKKEVIPNNIIEKAPSAELAPDQFDQDVLPEYDLLDAILEGLIEKELSAKTLSQTYPEEIVRWVATKLDRNEFKRRQMPPGIKLSQRAFGSGRRMPMAARFEFL